MIEINAENDLLEGIRSNGIEIIALCGGVGACDSCKIRILSGDVSDPTFTEQQLFTEVELSSGLRLACQVNALSDLIIEIPAESLSTPQRLQIEGQQIKIDPSPIVKAVNLHIPEPSLGDLRSDISRILDELQRTTKEPSLKIDYGAITSASRILRNNQWYVSIVMHNNLVIAILAPNSPLYGLAVDIGTTKIAAYLVELESGAIIAKGGRMNPQISFGEDIISRIAYTKLEVQGREILQSKLIGEINDLINELISKAHEAGFTIEREQIVDAVVVGNTAMHHIFSGLSVEQLGTSPYISTVSDSMLIPARELGLQIAIGSLIYLPPIVAGFVGPDHVAMLAAVNLPKLDEVCIALDIGTNTEITLSHNGNLYSCSCASGPAFEGAHIQAGMRASQGAIERIKIEGDEIYFTTIGSVPPIGICGSGILDAVSELVTTGVVNRSGGFNKDEMRIVNLGDTTNFMLVPKESSGYGQPIFITRKDINEVQLAKGAIRAGIEILLKEAGIKAHQVQKIYIAGAFGTYLDIKSAINIGMFPALPQEYFYQVGNAAGVGAVMLLLSEQLRRYVESFTQEIKYIELSNHREFTSEFSRALFFENAFTEKD